MNPFQLTKRVRYRECDPMGVVYHTHFLDYFEAARTEALRAAGLPYKELEADGIIMPVIELSVAYKRPAFYDDLLEIDTWITCKPPLVRVDTRYEVRRSGDPDLLVSGRVTLCFVDRTLNRPVPAPPEIERILGHGDRQTERSRG